MQWKPIVYIRQVCHFTVCLLVLKLLYVYISLATTNDGWYHALLCVMCLENGHRADVIIDTVCLYTRAMFENAAH